MKKTANIWEHNVGINAVIANFVCMSNVDKSVTYTHKISSSEFFRNYTKLAILT